MPRTHSLARAAAVATLALVASTLAVGTGPATAAKTPHGRLRIVVTGLAPGAKATITAKRPHHKALKATRTKTFKKAAPGRYTITVHALPGYSRSAKKLTVRVKAHHHKTVTIRFTRLRLKFTQLTSGYAHTCAVAVDHTAWCWGINREGELGSSGGVATDNAHPAMSQVPGGAVWASLSAGSLHTCGIRLDHSLWCWGKNGTGQLGSAVNNGSNVANPAPIRVPGGPVWQQVTAGNLHTCAIKRTDHTAWCWGWNAFGELGNETNEGSTTDANPYPLLVSGNAMWRSLSTGAYHTCGIKTDNSLWCWGSNGWGQLGNDQSVATTTPNADPLPIIGSGTWKAVSAGAVSTCGRRSDGTILCWGDNTLGELGNQSNYGQNLPNATPSAVSGQGVWTTLSVGSQGQHTCATRPNAVLWCWGSNGQGELADGTSGGTSPAPIPVPGKNWSSVTTGGGFTCALRAGDIWCWGSNRYGQIGAGIASGTDTDKSLVPIRVTAPWAVR